MGTWDRTRDAQFSDSETVYLQLRESEVAVRAMDQGGEYPFAVETERRHPQPVVVRALIGDLGQVGSVGPDGEQVLGQQRRIEGVWRPSSEQDQILRWVPIRVGREGVKGAEDVSRLAWSGQADDGDCLTCDLFRVVAVVDEPR